jgi:hypothetical protein
MDRTRGRLETEGKRKSLWCCRIPGKSAGVPGNGGSPVIGLEEKRKTWNM